MRIDDGKGIKPFHDLLNQPDIKDLFAMPYIPGQKGIPPELIYDSGRIRYRRCSQKCTPTAAPPKQMPAQSCGFRLSMESP
jgi:hypothetical protein